MPGSILHEGAVVLCSHGGTATPVSLSPRVTVSGQRAVTLDSLWLITACGLARGAGLLPCVSGEFMAGAARVRSGGLPLAVPGASVCTPTDTPMVVVSAQMRAVAT